MLPGPFGESLQLLGRGHTPTLGRESRAEHEPDVLEGALAADGARFRRRPRVVATDAHEFDLRIADLFAVHFTGPHRTKKPPAIEPVVDRARGVTRSARRVRLRKQHLGRLSTPGDGVHGGDAHPRREGSPRAERRSARVVPWQSNLPGSPRVAAPPRGPAPGRVTRPPATSATGRRSSHRRMPRHRCRPSAIRPVQRSPPARFASVPA